MTTRTLLITATLMIFTTTAQADFIIDISGYQATTPISGSIVANNTDTGAVTDISFDFTYEAGPTGGAAWGSDMLLELYHVPTDTAAYIGTQANSCDAFAIMCDWDLMWDDTTGIFTGSGTFVLMSAIADGSGDWAVTATSAFDSAFTEGEFLATSTITIGQEAAAVPVPGTLLLIGIGLAGMGLSRRRTA